jgi:hypothetical protein
MDILRLYEFDERRTEETGRLYFGWVFWDFRATGRHGTAFVNSEIGMGEGSTVQYCSIA